MPAGSGQPAQPHCPICYNRLPQECENSYQTVQLPLDFIAYAMSNFLRNNHGCAYNAIIEQNGVGDLLTIFPLFRVLFRKQISYSVPYTHSFCLYISTAESKTTLITGYHTISSFENTEN